jgi:hypothetical protein
MFYKDCTSEPTIFRLGVRFTLFPIDLALASEVSVYVVLGVLISTKDSMDARFTTVCSVGMEGDLLIIIVLIDPISFWN